MEEKEIEEFVDEIFKDVNNLQKFLKALDGNCSIILLAELASWFKTNRGDAFELQPYFKPGVITQVNVATLTLKKPHKSKMIISIQEEEVTCDKH